MSTARSSASGRLSSRAARHRYGMESSSRHVRRQLRPAARKTCRPSPAGSACRSRRRLPIFGNAKPKSGSHLLLQVLAGFARIMPYLPTWRPSPFEPSPRPVTAGRRRKSSQDLRRVPRGVVGWGYLEPHRRTLPFLCQPERVNYFIYRDPRDLLVSQVFFATDMYEDHGMHAYYRSLPDFAAG